MKIKDEFVVAEVDDRFVAVPVGAANEEFSGIIRMNETGTFIFKCLQEGMDEEHIAKKILDEFSDVDYDTALCCVKKITNQIKEEGLFK